MATRGASRRGHAVTNALGIVTLVLCVVLLLPQVPFTTKAPSWPQDVDSLLKVIPRGAAVLAYPFPDDPFTEAMSWQVADGMRFKLFGGYAVVQGRPDSGTVRPPLLNPPLVQEYFMQAQTRSSHALLVRDRELCSSRPVCFHFRARCRRSRLLGRRCLSEGDQRTPARRSRITDAFDSRRQGTALADRGIVATPSAPIDDQSCVDDAPNQSRGLGSPSMVAGVLFSF